MLLQPVFSNQKSFYKKAYVLDEAKYNDHLVFVKNKLYSYDTLICIVEEVKNFKTMTSEKELFVNKNEDVYTQTTLKHVKEFVKQFYDENIETNKKMLLSEEFNKF